MSAGVLLMCLTAATAQEGARATQQATFTSQALHFAQQVDELNLNEVYDRYKLFVVLRCKDVPVEQRKTLAIRIITGDYPNKPNFQWREGKSGAFAAAIAVLSHLHMEDTSLIPFLEEYLPKWERVVAISEEPLPADLQRLKQRTAPNVQMARALLIRLKAVQAVPEVKSAADLERRLEVMLKEAQMTRQEFQQLCEEFVEGWRHRRGMDIPSRAVLANYLLEEYGRMLFHYAKSGMSLELAAKNADTSIVTRFWSARIEMGRLASQPAKLIEELLKQKGPALSYGQLLIDEGVQVVPLIMQRLEAIKNDRGQVSDTGMGLVTLLQVLVTLAGESALPYIEPFAQDERLWLCHYARQAKEWIHEGRVFGFYADW